MYIDPMTHMKMH